MDLADATALFATKHQLTHRQIEVMHMVFEGRSPVEISGKLRLSIETVRNHMKGIYKRTGVASAPELLALLVAMLLPFTGASPVQPEGIAE